VCQTGVKRELILRRNLYAFTLQIGGMSGTTKPHDQSLPAVFRKCSKNKQQSKIVLKFGFTENL
jgi:hypothetical protein